MIICNTGIIIEFEKGGDILVRYFSSCGGWKYVKKKRNYMSETSTHGGFINTISFSYSHYGESFFPLRLAFPSNDTVEVVHLYVMAKRYVRRRYQRLKLTGNIRSFNFPCHWTKQIFYTAVLNFSTAIGRLLRSIFRMKSTLNGHIPLA